MRLAFMAYNWNTRRSAASYAQKVEDSREISKQYLSKNNFNNVDVIDLLMRNLESESLSHLNAAIVRAQNSIISQTLIDVLKSEKGRKEAVLKLQHQKELADMKSDQKETKRHELDDKAHLPAWTMLIDDADMN